MVQQSKLRMAWVNRLLFLCYLCLQMSMIRSQGASQLDAYVYEEDRNTNAGDVYERYFSEEESGDASGDAEDFFAQRDFTIRFMKSFKDALLDDTSRQFAKVSRDVSNAVIEFLARETLSHPEDFFVTVISFERDTSSATGSTLATVHVESNSYAELSQEELVEEVLHFGDSGRIGRARVTGIEEIAEYSEESSAAEEESSIGSVEYEVQIIYAKRFKKSLHDPTSAVFRTEKSVIEDEVDLYLLASRMINREELSNVTVHEFQQAPGRDTRVLLTVSLLDTSVERLKEALTLLEVGELNRRRVVRVGGELMNYNKNKNQNNSIDYDFTEIIDGSPTTDIGEAGSTDKDVPLEYGESSGDDETTPTNSTQVSDRQVLCPTLEAPKNGIGNCDDTNNPGSVCVFRCNEGKYMAGPSQTRCGRDGTWDGEAPSCRTIYCQPHSDAEELPNGEIVCSDHNRYGSECAFFCNEGYNLDGSATSVCKTNREWTHPNPICQLTPVDCVIAYSEWSDCEGGHRRKEGFVQQAAIGTGRPCPLSIPSMEEDCVHCRVDWGEWGNCSDGKRARHEYIQDRPVGVGEPCPELREDVELCIDCIVTWGSWSECDNGIRDRAERISVAKLGAGTPCPELQIESEACADCEVTWTGWSACADKLRNRSQIVSVEKIGAGRDCPLLRSQSEACVDCEMAWGEFGDCFDEIMTKLQVVVTLPLGAGNACPEAQSEAAACAHCVVGWEEWGPCVNNQRTRSQVISTPQLGTGLACPKLITQSEGCGATTSPSPDSVLCRYTREVLGYDGNQNKRDILLLGDESGSVGWINYEKIKNHFKAVTRHVRGGVGPGKVQLSLMSFASNSRIEFDFDDNKDTDAVVRAIDKGIYHGGRRSKIGRALSESSYWMFQQSAGMRGFPGKDDDITHEIVLATDGCRTSTGFHFRESIKTIKKRGIKLAVVGIKSPDPSCRGALRQLEVDGADVYEVGDWAALERFSEGVNNGYCRG